MDYTDFIKYLKQNLPDDKSLAYLAKIEKEHGKEAVIASCTGPIVSLNPEPTEPETFFDLLYYFPDLVYSGNNDLSYTKTLSTSSFLWPQGTSMYLNNDSTFVVDPNNHKDYFVFCVHIHRQSQDPNYKINLHIGLPNYTSDAGSYQYLIFNQLPNTTLYIPDHRDTGHGATKMIEYGVSFANLSRAAYTYTDNEITWPSNNVKMEDFPDSYLLLVGKKNINWNYTVYACLVRLFYDEDNKPSSKLMTQFDPFVISGTGYGYFIPCVNCVNITNQITTVSFFVNIIQWNMLDEDTKPFLLTDDLKDYLSNINIFD